MAPKATQIGWLVIRRHLDIMKADMVRIIARAGNGGHAVM
jgi:hypothetical protein